MNRQIRFFSMGLAAALTACGHPGATAGVPTRIDPAVAAEVPEGAEPGLAPSGGGPAADEDTGEPESWLHPAGARAAR